MGHMTVLTDAIQKCCDSKNELFETGIEYLKSEEWNEYIIKSFKETKEKNARLLGGFKIPNDGLEVDDMEADSLPEYEGKGGSDGNSEDFDFVSSEQFARFLCQQTISGLPDGLFHRISEEEESEAKFYDGDEVIDGSVSIEEKRYSSIHADDESANADKESSKESR
jgi:hypothetical protein